MSHKVYSIAETENFQKVLKDKSFSHLKKKIEEYVYPLLKQNPHFGPNIKKLKGSFSNIYRYRIADYRVFYTIEESELIVIFIDIQNRKDAYKKKVERRASHNKWLTCSGAPFGPLLGLAPSPCGRPRIWRDLGRIYKPPNRGRCCDTSSLRLDVR